MFIHTRCGSICGCHISIKRWPKTEFLMFLVCTCLSRGGMAFVQLALDRSTGMHVAIKFLARFGGEFDARTVARELANHKMCAGHPHIVQLKVSMQESHPVRTGIVHGSTTSSVTSNFCVCRRFF